MIGKTLGHYRVVEKLGAGGMGVVYKAQDLHLDRFVALKVLPPEKVVDAERKRRFTQEAKAASALNHPNIVHIYDITADQGVNFIAMEYVEGKTLEQQIGRRSLRPNDVLKYAVQVADALAKAHAAGIVHRDLKPGNIMVNEDGAAKVLDFGLAKLTEQVSADEFGSTATADATEPVTERGTIVGTVAYMSPEQAEGKPVDPRSDIFSFGSVLYEMATGRRAFQGDSKIATLSSILHQEPAPVSSVAGGIPQELERIITRCLKKDPARRFQHMADVKVALEELKEESESGKLVSQSGTAAKERRSPKFIVASAMAGILLSHLDWSRGSGLLLGVTRLENGNWTIWTFRADGSGGHKVVEEREDRIGSALWSATGDAVYYFRDKGNMWGTLSDLMKVSIDSASGEAKDEPSVMSSGMEVDSDSLSLSGDGSRLVYTRRRQSNNLWSAEISGSETQKRLEIKPLTKGTLRIGSNNISPDGKWVAFATYPPNANIYKMPIDGGPSVQLTSSNSNHRSVVWSPNGKRMTFVSDEGGSNKVWIEDADGGTPRRLAKTQPLPYPIGWAPGLKILYRTGSLAHEDLKIMDPDTEEEKPLIPSSSVGPIASFKSSPDGNRIAVSSDSGLWVISLKDNSESLLTKERLIPCGWSQDGSLVYVVTGAAERTLLAIPAAGGNPRPMVTLPKGISPGSMSPDGRKFVYTEREAKSDVWLMENFDPARRR